MATYSEETARLWMAMDVGPLWIGRDDEDLIRLLASRHQQIDRRADDDRDDVSVNHVGERVSQQQCGADDENVRIDDDFLHQEFLCGLRPPPSGGKGNLTRRRSR